MSDAKQRVPNVDEFLAEIDDPAGYDWIVPGLIERGDRVIITAPEGAGKSTLLRQVGLLAAAGLHPFTLEDIEPVRCMLVDLENSKRQVRRELHPMRAQLNGTLDPDRLRVEVYPQGMNITWADHREVLEQQLDEVRPDLLLIGPRYKLLLEDDADAEEWRHVTTILDQLRVRYDFAVIIEDHTPHSGKHPINSSLFKRWPEFGFYLSASGKLETFRGMRDASRAWPEQLRRGGEWPWTVNGATSESGPAEPGDADRKRWQLFVAAVRHAGESLTKSAIYEDVKKRQDRGYRKTDMFTDIDRAAAAVDGPLMLMPGDVYDLAPAEGDDED